MKYQWANKSVLFAEDDEASALYITELLNLYQATVIHCVSGLAALTYVLNGNPVDLVLMDMKLPELNGFETTRMIKHCMPSLPVIAVTACAMLEDRRRCADAGCDGYLSKPVMPEEILPMVHSFLNRQQTSSYAGIVV
ncbi:MAG: response regulator [Bacteroidales bacterium]|nr:response regulator [Bacteroidales bacterium]